MYIHRHTHTLYIHTNTHICIQIYYTQRRLAREAAEEQQAAAAAAAGDASAYATQMETELGRAQEGAQALHQTLEQVQPHVPRRLNICVSVSRMLNICVSHGTTHVSFEQLSQMIEQLQQAATAATETAAAAAAAAASAAGERDRLEQEKKDLVQAAEEAHRGGHARVLGDHS